MCLCFLEGSVFVFQAGFMAVVTFSGCCGFCDFCYLGFLVSWLFRFLLFLDVFGFLFWFVFVFSCQYASKMYRQRVKHQLGRIKGYDAAL